MGAVPTALLVGLAAPGDLPVAWAEEMAAGLAEECSGVGAPVAGGDLSGAPLIMLAVTALGALAGRAPVTRSGARPGDLWPWRACSAFRGRLALLQAGLGEPRGWWPRTAGHIWTTPRGRRRRGGHASMID